LWGGRLARPLNWNGQDAHPTLTDFGYFLFGSHLKSIKGISFLWLKCQSMPKKVAIVGPGPGGLATAMRLASLGCQVQMFEAADRVGGRMRGFEIESYALDTGPTILQVPRVYKELFAECGLKLSDYIKFKQLNPNARIRFWDGCFLTVIAAQLLRMTY
jgi:heterodisulfide reductase subunit A-like polyferredoxin